MNRFRVGKVARMTLVTRWVCVAVVMAGSVVGCAPDAGAQDEVVARVGDAEVTFADVEESWNETDASERLRLLQQVYETRRRALDIVIGDRLIAREAQARGLTRAELLAAELPSRTSPVTDEEVARIYERNRSNFGDQTPEQMQSEIRMLLEQQRPTQALHQFMSELHAAADDVVVMLDPPRQAVDVLADDPSRGPDDAGRHRGVLRLRVSLLPARDRNAWRSARALRRSTTVCVQGFSVTQSPARVQGSRGGQLRARAGQVLGVP